VLKFKKKIRRQKVNSLVRSKKLETGTEDKAKYRHTAAHLSVLRKDWLLLGSFKQYKYDPIMHNFLGYVHCLLEWGRRLFTVLTNDSDWTNQTKQNKRASNQPNHPTIHPSKPNQPTNQPSIQTNQTKPNHPS
jgi:hypothetical protein